MKKNIEISPNIETLFGTRDENLRLLEDGLNVTIAMQPDSIEIEGAASDVGRAEQVFTDYQLSAAQWLHLRERRSRRR